MVDYRSDESVGLLTGTSLTCTSGSDTKKTIYFYAVAIA